MLGLGLALGLAGCAPAPEAPITVTAPPAPRQLRLDNGLVVVLDADMAATSAFVHVRYHVGAKDDPVSRAGLAHLVEHLTFEAPTRPGDLDRMTMLERIGAVDVNGTTAFDSTDFYAATPPSLLAYALWVEASRMAHPVDGLDGDAPVEGDALRRELAVVENELRTRSSADAYRLADELLAEALFGSAHPYGRIANGSRGELAVVTMPEVRAFASLHYQPSNATLVVSGRFDVDETARLVTRYFGTIHSRPLPPRDPPGPTAREQHRRDVRRTRPGKDARDGMRSSRRPSRTASTRWRSRSSPSNNDCARACSPAMRSSTTSACIETEGTSAPC